MILTFLTFLSAPIVDHAPKGWTLAWSDEFTGNKLDSSKWSIGLPWTGDDGTNRHHNNQYASVIADEDVSVHDGCLWLTSRRAEVPNPKGGSYHFTEGLITTSGKFKQTYGYYVMRAKLPTEAGPGSWPAFWMLSEGWPPEMDILEYWGSNNRTHQGTVVKTAKENQRWDSHHESEVSLAGWHTYGMQWGPGYQIYDVDGVPTNRINADYIPTEQCYILLNSGVESSRPPTAGSTFPNAFVVDWVHVYQHPAGPVLLGGDFEELNSWPWKRDGQAAAGDTSPHSGKRSMRLDGPKASISQTVYGLEPGKSTEISLFAKSSNGASVQVRFGGSTQTFSLSPQYRILRLVATPAAKKEDLEISIQGDGTAFVDDVSAK